MELRSVLKKHNAGMRLLFGPVLSAVIRLMTLISDMGRNGFTEETHSTLHP